MDRLGGPKTLKVQTLPVPEVGLDEVLIHVEAADVAARVPFEREGGFGELFEGHVAHTFPPGSRQAGLAAKVNSLIECTEQRCEQLAIARKHLFKKIAVRCRLRMLPIDYSKKADSRRRRATSHGD